MSSPVGSSTPSTATSSPARPNPSRVTKRASTSYASMPVVVQPVLAQALQQHPDGVKAFSHRRVASDPMKASWQQASAQQATIALQASGAGSPPSPRPSHVFQPALIRAGSPHMASCDERQFWGQPGGAVSADVQARLAARSLAAMPGAGINAPSSRKQTASLPAEANGWTQLEVNLFMNSDGEYHPQEMAKRRRLQPSCPIPGRTGSELEVRGRVSIVSPTMDTRQHYHENLWACFEAQTWPDKELIVIETYTERPSEFLRKKAAEDSRLVHICMQRPAGNDFTVGLKRNMTLHVASGEYVVNFDDDDLYAENYVESMVSEMRSKNLEAVTLSAWYNYFAGKGLCTYSDPDGWAEWADDEEQLDNILYGYGFSYAHKRAISLKHPYPNVGFAEDAPLMMKFREVCGDHKVGLMRDEEGICMHIMHRANTAQVLGTCNVRSDEIGNLAVATLAPFQKQIEMDFSWWSPWKPKLSNEDHPASQSWGIIGGFLGGA